MNTNLPRYTDTDGCTYEYEPPAELCSLRRYNIAHCARQRMQIEHFNGYHADDDYKQSVERWKRERVSFWSTLAHSIPHNFKVNR
jgi:hypothetical protein